MSILYPKLRRRLVRCTLLSTLSVFAQPSYAQGTPPPAPASDAPEQTEQNSGGAGVQDIIVTAQRRNQNLQDVPVAVTAFGAKDLEERQVRNVRDLVLATPNLQILRIGGTDPNFVAFSIRGFNIQRPLIGVQQPVAVYVDDFYYPSLSGSVLRVLDLQSVEVLRGPQGTLFGRNSLGGAIRYNTLAPNNEFGGHVDVTLGERKRLDISGSVNIPIADFLAVRLTAGSLRQDGYVIDTTNGRPVGNSENTVFRAQVRLTPASNLTIDVTAESVRSRFDGDTLVVSNIATTGPFISPMAVTTNRADAATDGGVVTADGLGVIYQRTFVPTLYNTGTGPFPAPAGPKYNSAYVGSCRFCASGTTNPEYSDTLNRNIRGTIAWSPTDWATIKSLTSYFKISNRNLFDGDRTPLFVSQTVGSSDIETFSQEIQIGGKALDDRLDYVAGFYYFRNVQDDSTVSSGFPPTVRTATSAVRSNAYAAYAQVSFKPVPGLTLTVGGRQSWENVIVRSNALEPPQAQFKGFTPTFKAQYQFTPDIMGYVSAAKGFRGGTINTVDVRQAAQVPAALALSVVSPDTAWSYEAGVRSTFFDRRLLINVTAFKAIYENPQLTRAFAPPPGGLPIPATILQNAGRSIHEGIEVEAQAVLGALRLRGTLTTLNARFTDVGAAADITVNSYIERTPKLTYSLGASYEVPVGRESSVRANLDYGWQARQVSGNQDHVSSFMPAYGVMNGRLALEVNSHVTVALQATNLLNEFYLLRNGNNLYYTGVATYDPGEPRTFSVSIQGKF